MAQADDAYRAAEAEIAHVAAAGGTTLNLSGNAFRALAQLPASLTDLTDLQRLFLSATQIADTAPLPALTNLQVLSLSGTQISDLSAIARFPNLRAVWFENTNVRDLRPLLTCPALASDERRDVEFKNTEATRHDPELARLAEVTGDRNRTDQTLAYLRTLPEWPAPLPWQSGPHTSDAKASVPPQVQAADTQIKFLLSHAAVSQVGATHLADQIRFALREVPAEDGSNQLPDALQAAADVASVLARLGKADLSDKNTQAEDVLRRHIASLEARIAVLTSQLANETKAREAAEALAKANGFWPSAKKSAGTAAGAGTVALFGVAVPTSLVYFLGANHALVKSLLTVLGRLPR